MASTASGPVMQGTDVDTGRIRTHCWVSGPEDGIPVLLVHGNLVSGRWWGAVAERLSRRCRVVAPDLRGFGRTAPLPVDATRGVRDWSDDLRALVETLGWADGRRVHAAGWSLGGGVLQRYAIDRADDLATVTLVAPISPYGFGGTKDRTGTPCHEDFAGSGGAAANPDFVRRLAARDRSADAPTSSPRVVMRTFFYAEKNAPSDEGSLLEETLLTTVADANYPGTSTASPHWPGFAPGDIGTQNAISPRWCDTSAFASIEPAVPVLWVRGAEDPVVSDASMFDLGTLGRLGAVPDWPGEEVFPSQPQVGQIHAMLERYERVGGRYREVVLEGVGHGVPVERPDELAAMLDDHIHGATA